MPLSPNNSSNKLRPTCTLPERSSTQCCCVLSKWGMIFLFVLIRALKKILLLKHDKGKWKVEKVLSLCTSRACRGRTTTVSVNGQLLASLTGPWFPYSPHGMWGSSPWIWIWTPGRVSDHTPEEKIPLTWQASMKLKKPILCACV